MAMIDEIKKEIFCSMKFSDTTIAGIKETEEYKIKRRLIIKACVMREYL